MTSNATVQTIALAQAVAFVKGAQWWGIVAEGTMSSRTAKGAEG